MSTQPGEAAQDPSRGVGGEGRGQVLGEFVGGQAGQREAAQQRKQLPAHSGGLDRGGLLAEHGDSSAAPIPVAIETSQRGAAEHGLGPGGVGGQVPLAAGAAQRDGDASGTGPAPAVAMGAASSRVRTSGRSSPAALAGDDLQHGPLTNRALHS